MSIVCSLFTICQIELFSWSGDGGVLHRPGTSVCASVFPVLLCLAVHAVVGLKVELENVAALSLPFL